MEDRNRFPFKKENYIIISAGLAIVLIGFMLMSGGGSEDPNVFHEDELFSARRITLAPIVVLLGFVAVAVGILRKPKSD